MVSSTTTLPPKFPFSPTPRPPATFSAPELLPLLPFEFWISTSPPVIMFFSTPKPPFRVTEARE